MEEKFVDIKKLLKDKNPNLFKKLPGFVLSYLKKIIHEDDVNFEIERNFHFNGIEFSNMVLEKFHIDLHVKGKENIPKTGRYIVVANHPIGSIDSNALVSVIGEHRKDMYFFANDLLWNLPSMRDLLIPINKHGSNIENLRIINEYFKSDALILYYPAGLVSRKIGKEIKDLEWQKTFITQAKKHNRDIVPLHIEGKLSNFFYNLYKIRKFLKINQAIEMLYLVDEMYKQNGKAVRLTFGKAIPWQKFDNSNSDKEWSQIMKKHIYLLSANSKLTF
jgi:putative hemolysin